MKYTYTTATGIEEIEVDEQFNDLLTAMDKDQFNSDRKHGRHNSISLESCEYEGEWFKDKYDSICEVEFTIDLERAEASLTDLQQHCFTETKRNGKTQQEVAVEIGISRSTVQQAVDGAIAVLKKFFI